jgi:uncharacterized Zn-finger protein
MRFRTGPTRFSLRRKGSSKVTAERSDRLIQPNAQQQYEVTVADLPLACPMPGMHLWNSHPRVFLPIEKTGSAKCPYCTGRVR